MASFPTYAATNRPQQLCECEYFSVMMLEFINSDGHGNVSFSSEELLLTVGRRVVCVSLMICVINLPCEVGLKVAGVRCTLASYLGNIRSLFWLCVCVSIGACACTCSGISQLNTGKCAAL